MSSTFRHSQTALLAAALVCTGCRAPSTPLRAAPDRADSVAVRRDVSYLASERIEGRGTGTPGGDSAAAFLAARYAALGVEPLTAASCPGRVRRCAAAFYQPFTARSLAAAHAGRPYELPTQNVVARVPGTDPALRGEYVVIGAHYDHLGRSIESALDPEAGAVVRNGADDNASGTAAVLELARLFARRPARRTIIFANFAAEELGILGSQYFVANAPVPIDSVRAMLNFDMVGRLRANRLIVYGAATAAELPGVLDSANVAPALELSAVGDGFGPSDQASFYARGVPVLHFFTGLHEDYHRATDDADKVDAGGEARVIDFAARVARALADGAAPLTPLRAGAPVASAGAGRESRVYFGSIPDMAAQDAEGIRLAGVSAGSPAENAGLRAGDVVVQFGGTAVTDLYAYSKALYARQPGDVVSVVVLRGGRRLSFTATLGTRGR